MNAPVKPHRLPEHPVDPLFIERHSPRAFTDETMTRAELMTLLEAARWAPSGANVQPTRLVWGLRGDAGFERIAATLAPGNRVWAEKAAALVVIASKTFTGEGDDLRAHISHAFDAGAAWMSLALQAHLQDWVAHAMGGFDKAAAAETLGLPEGHDLHVVVALGRKGTPELLPEAYRPREVPSTRLPLAEIARHGSF